MHLLLDITDLKPEFQTGDGFEKLRLSNRLPDFSMLNEEAQKALRLVGQGAYHPPLYYLPRGILHPPDVRGEIVAVVAAEQGVPVSAVGKETRLGVNWAAIAMKLYHRFNKPIEAEDNMTVGEVMLAYGV